jgi:hypothetical protein
MKKTNIKVIKRNEVEPKAMEAPTVVKKTEQEIRRHRGNVVQDWISERRENSRLERDFTERHIVAWKTFSQS